MKHPQSEEWLLYFEREASPEATSRLSKHLANCPACAAEVQAHRRTIQRLRRLEWPKPYYSAPRSVQPALRWAIAAAVVLGVGFGLGQLSSRPAAGALRVQVEKSVRASLASEWQSALSRSQRESSNALAAAEARLNQGSETETRQLWRDFVEALSAAREEDRRATVALLERLQQQHDARYVALRKELETLASLTDEEIRQARQKLIQLAGASQFNEEK